MASKITRGAPLSLSGLVRRVEIEALSLLGVTTVAQIKKLDEARAVDLAKLLAFADLHQLDAPGALTVAVRKVEAQYGMPFRETPVAKRLEPFATIAPVTSVLGADQSWLDQEVEVHAKPPRRRRFSRKDEQGIWRALGREHRAILRSLAALPEPLIAYVRRIQASIGDVEAIDAIRELARSASGKIYTGGAPIRKNREAARAAYDHAIRSGHSKNAAILRAAKEGGYSPRSRSHLFSLATRQWDKERK